MVKLEMSGMPQATREEQSLFTYLGLIEDPIIVGIISEGFLDASRRAGNVAIGDWLDFDRHTVDGAFWALRCRIQNAHTTLRGEQWVRVNETN
jgi:hypothetical protein